MTFYRFLFIIIIVLFLLFNNKLKSQDNTTDSLLTELQKSNVDTLKINLLLTIGDTYEFTNPDTANFYYNEALQLSLKINDKKLIAKSYLYIGIILREKGNFKDAIGLINKALALYTEISYKPKLISCYTNIALVYQNWGNYPEAIKYHQMSLKISEELKDSTTMAGSNINIGIIYKDRKDYTLATEYYNNAINIYKALNDENGLSIAFNNLGLVYSELGDISKSVEYYKEALKIFEKYNYPKGIAFCYNNIGNAYGSNKNFKEALDYFEKALAVEKSIDDKAGISLVLGNISELNIELKHYDEAIKYSLESLTISEEIGALENQRYAYEHLFLAYNGIEDYKNSLKYHILFKNINDSIFNDNNNKLIKEMEGKYQTEKKQLQIENLEKDNSLKKSEIQKQKILIFSFILGFIIILVFSVFLYRLFIQKKKANKQLAQKNIEVEQKNEEITAQRDEISAQRDLVTKQKTEIEHIHEELTDSINYAKRIQEAVLPISEEYRSIMGEHFILFRPKDIVSGDFYWTAKIGNTLIIAVADCTGHGVPGAFMSMLGISFLNEIVRNKTITKANEVLNELRKEIINALQQKGQAGEQKDGMDMSLLAIDTISHEAQWAGANNPLWVVKSSKTKDTNLKTQENSSLNLEFETCFLELKADKMPIAIYEKMDSFTNHDIQLEKGDCVYLMSDGYEDQFGGSKGKKFLSKNLKQLLLDNSKKSMTEQKEILEKTLFEWIGEGEQIDDITLVGIKI